MQNLAYFCEKLSKIPDGDGTVLDHVLIYKGSNMGNSHRHAHEKVPVILVGGIDGTFKGNRHLVFPDNTQRTSNMLLSLLHLYGIEMDKIGTSTGGCSRSRWCDANTRRRRPDRGRRVRSLSQCRGCPVRLPRAALSRAGCRADWLDERRDRRWCHRRDRCGR